jgi:hypothetical protein
MTANAAANSNHATAVVQTDLDRLKAQAQGDMKLPMPLLSMMRLA